MQFCMEHWNKLRAAIEARGLTPLVSSGGKSAIEKTVDQLNTGENTLENYDPLMGAHWAIMGNVMKLIGHNGLYLLNDDDAPEDPVEGYPGYEGRTWPRCPLCYINLVHEVTCDGGKCKLSKIGGYEWMIDRAADESKDTVDRLMKG